MSASREKKARQELNASGYVDPRAAHEAEEKTKARRSSILYSAIAVVFVIVAVVTIVLNSNVIERNAKAYTAGDETFTAADVNYYYHNIYNSFVSQNSSYLSYYFDTTKDLREQECFINGSTWFDYFKDQAIAQLKNIALLSQKAEAEGFDASEEMDAAVKSSLDSIDVYAAAAGYTRAQYLKSLFGATMSENVFKRNVRMSALAQAYSNAYDESLVYSDADLQAAYDASPKTYQSVDIEYILFTSDAATDATDEEKAAALDAAKQKADDALSAFAAGESFESAGTEMEGTYRHSAYTGNGSSDMLTWAFDDARADGDTTVVPYGESGYYAVLFHSRAINDYFPVSVRHILVEDEETANSLLELWQDGDKTEDSFAQLATENSTDTGSASTGGLYENIGRGQMVQPFEDWCFDAARRTGDTGVVKTDYGYHVMYFVSTGSEPMWKLDAKSDLSNADYTEWLTAITDAAAAEELDGIKYVG